MNEWVQHAVCWHVFPLGFVGAEPEMLPAHELPRHRLKHLDPWLDYLVELGASALLLGPIFEASSHGYDTVDYFSIDRRLGDDADFDALVDAAHRRGVRVILDGVFNHVSRAFPRFQQALREGPESPAGDWFHLFWQPGRDEPEYEHFEGHRQLVTLNHASPQVVEFIASVMTYWLDRGADGWRLDAAYAVDPRFWAAVVDLVRERHADAWLFGEVIHGEYAEFVSQSHLDSVTQYELWKAIWSSLNDHNLHELAWTLSRHDEMLKTFVPVTFLGNHDVTRIASRLQDPQHLQHAIVILMTVGGTPCVYAGDEQGFTGIKEDRPGGDDAIRPAFPARPDELSPAGRSVFDRHREMIALRRRHSWLHAARTDVEVVTNELLVYRSHSDGNGIRVALNLAATAATLPTGQPGRLLAGSAMCEGPEPGTACTLPPNGWAVFSA